MDGIAQEQLDRVFGAPLDEFVAVRKEVADELAAGGDADQAAAVRALRKPSLPAWAVNQLARGQAAALTRLLDATAAVRRAQGGGRGDFGEARRELDGAVGELVGAARATIESSGKKPTETMLRRVEQTLRGAATSQPDELRRGVLTAEVEPAGFEALLAATPDGAARRGEARRHARAQPSEVTAARRQLSAARAEVDKLTREARNASRAASSAHAAWERARDEEARAEAALEQAERAVADADQRLRALRGQSAGSPSRAAGD